MIVNDKVKQCGPLEVVGGDVIRYLGDLYLVPDSELFDSDGEMVIGVALSNGDHIVCTDGDHPPNGDIGRVSDSELVAGRFEVD